MTKPFGYYTSYTPGDGSFFEKLEQQYGATFERITLREKLFLISGIATQLSTIAAGETRSEIESLLLDMNENFSASDLAGLIEAMIAQVRWGQNSPVSGAMPME